MKIRILPTLFLASLFFFSSAQKLVPPDLNEHSKQVIIDVPLQPELKNKWGSLGWLSPVSMWEAQGAFWQGSTLTLLFPDSTVLINLSDTAAYPINTHLIGTVFEPTEPFYKELSRDQRLVSRISPYHVDSVRFKFGYFRNVDSIIVNQVKTEVVDTCVVHFYNSDNLQRWYVGIAGNWEDHVFTIPNENDFNARASGPMENIWNDTILLTKSIATPIYNQGYFMAKSVAIAIPYNVREIPPNINLDGAQTIGVSIIYKPMQVYQKGDTLINFDTTLHVKNKLNSFGTITYANEGTPITQNRFANNSFITNTKLLSGGLYKSLKGYYPTLKNFSWNTDVFFDAEFCIETFGNIDDDKILHLTIQASPNPIQQGELLNLQVDQNVAISEFDVSLHNLLGAKVDVNVIPKGNNKFCLETNSLVPGVYFVSINTLGANGTYKLTVMR